MAKPGLSSAGPLAAVREQRDSGPPPRLAVSTRAMPAVLRALHETDPPTGGVLSTYVDTSPERSLGHAFLLGFRARSKALRADVPADGLARFDAMVAQTATVLTDWAAPGPSGLAVFASGDPTYLFASRLPLRPPETVLLGAHPVVAPLEAMLDDAERAVILLFDKERARLFTVFLGEIEERREMFSEVPGKQKTGDWFALSQKRYERHHEDHVRRHASETIAAVLDELDRHPFDRLLIGGPDEAIALLADHLPRRLRIRLAGRLAIELFASDAEVLAAAQDVLRTVEREHEVAAVRRLLDDAGTPRVAVGIEPTLLALSDGRVHHLFIANDTLGGGRECPGCGLLTRHEERCSRCGATTRPVPDLREQAVAAAVDTGARVEFVAGEAATLLAPHGGIGARTRWDETRPTP